MQDAKDPIVSIILPVMNQEKLVGKTIESVLAQSLKEWELIVVNDGSTDGTEEVIQSLAAKDSRIIYLDNGKNIGIPKTFNKAVGISKGKYIARVDSDDAWTDYQKLEKQVAFLEAHPDYSAVGGGMIVVDPEGHELYRYLKPEMDEAIRKSALVTSPISSSVSLCRKDAVLKVGIFDEHLNFNEDWDFFLKIGTVGKMYNFPEYFSYYTMTGRNRSAVYLKAHTLKAFEVLFRYRTKYPNFAKGFLLNLAQFFYGFIPFGIRLKIHPALSHVKKIIAGSKLQSR